MTELDAAVMVSFIVQVLVVPLRWVGTFVSAFSIAIYLILRMREILS